MAAVSEPSLGALTWPVSLRMAAVTGVHAGQRVLDVGCGPGDPTLQVAVLVGPHGSVVGLDLAEDLLEIGRARAAALGLGHVEFRRADVTTATLEREAYDVVLGRFSVTHLVDPVAVLGRLHEALVPGGAIAITGWAPAEANPWIEIPRRAIERAQGHAAPARVGPFVLSGDGELARALLAAGFQAVQQERVQLSLVVRDVAALWTLAMDPAGPLAALVAPLTEPVRQRAAGAIGGDVAPFQGPEGLRIPGQAQLAWGRV